MVKKIIFLTLILYFLTLFQTSFFAHFRLFGVTLNLVLILIIVFNILEKSEEKLGILSAFLGGFFLDIFSIGSQNLFFGFYTLLSLILALFIKLILKRYVRIPVAKKF